MIQKLSLFFAFTIIFLFALFSRLYLLSFPRDFVFDERYHVPAVWLIIDQDKRAFEWWHQPIYGQDNHDWLHPPLAKYLQATSISEGEALTGQTDPYFWRLPSVVFGVMGVLMVAYLAWVLFRNIKIALLAALLLSLDGLWLVLSRTAMNDIFVSVWILGAITSYALYIKEKRLGYLVGVGSALGLALATKWTGGLMILGIFSFEMGRLISVYSRKKKAVSLILKRLPWLVFTVIGIPVLIYLFSYLPVLFQPNGFEQFIGLHQNILGYQFNRVEGHVFASRPLQWLVNDAPVWFWGENTLKFRADIIASGNPLGVALGVLALSWAVIKGRKDPQSSAAVIFVMWGIFVLWFPWLFSPRVVFYHHFLPATPLIALLTAVMMERLFFFPGDRRRVLLWGVLFLLLVVSFWLYYPIWLGLPIQENYVFSLFGFWFSGRSLPGILLGI